MLDARLVVNCLMLACRCCSRPWNAELSQRNSCPFVLIHIKNVEALFSGIDAVDELAEGAGNVVAAKSEFGFRAHLRLACTHTGLLVDLLNLSGIELECLKGLTTKYEHISAVELDASDGLRLHKLCICYL